MAEYFCCSPLGTAASILNSVLRGHIETLACCGCLAPVAKQIFGDNSVALVTGGNRGVGYHTAQILLNQGLVVYILCRDLELGKEAARKLAAATCCATDQVQAFHVDLGDLSTVAAFIEEVERKNIGITSLVNNAGIISTDSMRVNHLGHFALTLGLIPALQRGAKLHRGWLSCIGSGGASVVNVASVAHIEGGMTIANWARRAAEAAVAAAAVVPEDASDSATSAVTVSPNSLHGVKNSDNLWEPQRRDAWSEYGLSKCANVVFSNSLATRLDTLPGESYSGIRVSSYHPGVMASDLWTSGELRNEGSNTREWIRRCLFPCVKHPCMSAAGLASLANPRVGLSSCDSNCLSRVAAICCTAFMGGSGGYYQQSCQLCVIPVRAMPVTNDCRVQDDLWLASLAEVKQRHDSLGQRLEQVDKQFSQHIQHINSETDLPQQQHCQYRVSPALPCSEILTVMPYCVCFTCLF